MDQRKFTAITLGVVALHGAALWAVHSYRAPVASVDKTDALVTRTVEPVIEPPKVIQAAPPPVPVPAVKPPLNPSPKPAPPAKATPAATTPLPVALNNPTPAPNASTGSAAPAAATPPAPAAVAADTAAQTASAAPPTAAPAAAKAPAQPAVTLQPSTDADHADTQYRIALPAISARLGEYGRVLVRVQVGTDGRALQVQLLKSSGYARLDDNALATVARWRFKPGSVNGVPTVGWVEQPVNYAAQ
jgi:periplasmic protein TonB